MAPGTPLPRPSPSLTFAARFIGLAHVVLSFAFAVTSAVALAKLAHHSTSTGLVLLSIVLGARWLLVARHERVEHPHCSPRSKGLAYELIDHLRLPRREGERSRSDLATAIDHVASGPSLEALATSARASVVGLVIVFWAAGWLSTLITLTLMAFADTVVSACGATE